MKNQKPQFALSLGLILLFLGLCIAGTFKRDQKPENSFSKPNIQKYYS